MKHETIISILMLVVITSCSYEPSMIAVNQNELCEITVASICRLKTMLQHIQIKLKS